MKKTIEAVKKFLEQVEADKVLSEKQLEALYKEKQQLDTERRDISKAIVRFEAEGDQVSADKLAGELSTRIQKLGVIESKIVAYTELSNNYEDEAERVYALAAKECFEEYPLEISKQNGIWEKKRKEVEKFKALLKDKELEETQEYNKLTAMRTKRGTVIAGDLRKIKEYLPLHIKKDIPNGYDVSSTTTALEEYYNNVKDHVDKKGTKESKKPSFIEKLLGK